MNGDVETALAAPLAGVSPSDPLYRGLSSAAANNLRARMFAGHVAAGAPAREVVEAAREELTYGDQALTVAAAALLLVAHDGAATSDADFERAAKRLRLHDVAYDLDLARPSNCVTALDVLHRCASEAGARPVCCGGDAEAPGASPTFEPIDLTPLGDVALEDQDGRRLTFGEVFFGRPGFLTFFYTRCMIPEKCSATVHRLSRLASLTHADAQAGDPTIAALTYDPDFDNAHRLRTYGALRGVAFDARVKLLRSVDDLTTIRERLALGVGYGPSTVNSHRLEAYVLSPQGHAVRAILRRAWHENEALRALRAAARDAD